MVAEHANLNVSSTVILSVYSSYIARTTGELELAAMALKRPNMLRTRRAVNKTRRQGKMLLCIFIVIFEP